MAYDYQMVTEESAGLFIGVSMCCEAGKFQAIQASLNNGMPVLEESLPKLGKYGFKMGGIVAKRRLLGGGFIHLRAASANEKH
jgi:hypothetical protein